MRRQQAHLSTDKATALQVGRRKTQQPVLLAVRASEAFRSGVLFYEGNESTWLADEIPAGFVERVGI
jgi:putative RNA 2'-phosphotransferase